VGSGTTLAVGDSWTYTCTVSVSSAGTVTDQATGTGTAGDGRGEGTPASDGATQNELSNSVSVVGSAPAHTSAGGGTTTTTTTTTLEPTTTTTAAAGHLAFTGAPVGPLMAAAGIFLGLGLALVGVARRRVSASSRS
jgi:hypothetical protein